MQLREACFTYQLVNSSTFQLFTAHPAFAGE